MPKTQTNNGVQLPFKDENFIAKWQEWLQYRKERRLASYVPTGLKQTFSKLINISHNDPLIAIQIIDQSISNGWMGLFQLKTINHGATSSRINQEKPQPAGNVTSGGFGQL